MAEESDVQLRTVSKIDIDGIREPDRTKDSSTGASGTNLRPSDRIRVSKNRDQNLNVDAASMLFEMRKGLLRPQDVARLLGISVRTVYDWHHRPHRRSTPSGLFVKFNGHLFVKVEALDLWMTQQASR